PTLSQTTVTQVNCSITHGTPRRVQDTRLTTRYRTDEAFSLRIRQISTLAFLPPNEIPDTFNKLKGHIPEEADSIRPIILPAFWSVHENNEYNFLRTNNSVKAWHRMWKTLIGSSNLNIFKFIKEIQKEQNRVQFDIIAILRETPRPFQGRLNTASADSKFIQERQ
ncbi:15728_t:CDS:2, partial [Dentiscutata heterogama]